jgi:hypothetical protein
MLHLTCDVCVGPGYTKGELPGWVAQLRKSGVRSLQRQDPQGIEERSQSRLIQCHGLYLWQEKQGIMVI